MKRNNFILPIFLLFHFLLFVENDLKAQGEILRIIGIVYDEEGAPFSGVKVEDGNDTQTPKANYTTGADGKYIINTKASNPELNFTKNQGGNPLILPISVTLTGTDYVKEVNVHLEPFSNEGVGDLDEDILISGKINDTQKVQLVLDHEHEPAANGALTLRGTIYKINLWGNRQSLSNAIIKDKADSDAAISYPNDVGFQIITNPDDNRNPNPEFSKRTLLGKYLPVSIELEGRDDVSEIYVVLDKGNSGNDFNKAMKVKGKNKNKTKVQVVMDDSHGPRIKVFFN